MESKILVVDAGVSLKPYLAAAAESADFEKQLEQMGFEVAEEKPARQIGYLAAAKRSRRNAHGEL